MRFNFNFIVVGVIAMNLLGCGTSCDVNSSDSCNSSGSGNSIKNNDKPKLIIGITIDQMRADYLHRYASFYSDGGFNRLTEGGFTCNNHHFGYAPTYTGPGHASIYTGTTPAIHGIVANNWYIREDKALIYCTSDPAYAGVGVDGVDEGGNVFGFAGNMAPTRLLSTTIGDELKLATGLKSKVIGLSLKDRGAILPAGHSADGAFWFFGKDLGHFISSTYYCEELPSWVSDFNRLGEAERLCSEGWDRLLPETAYSECTPDNNPYEGTFTGEIRPTFPYDLNALKAENSGYDVLKGVPAGNTILVDFALAAIDGEELGADEFCDLLAVSFSATDYVGHRFGAHAQETMDIYVRLDLELERFFNALDEKVGKDQWTVFLTADHGGATVPSYGQSIGLPADYWSSGNMQDRIENALDSRFGNQTWIENISNNQIFITPSLLNNPKFNTGELERYICKLAVEEDGLINTIAAVDLASTASVDPIAKRIYAGYQPGVSGDVMLIFKPGWMTYGRTGTTHGSPYAYDTHVPCLLYGAGVTKGETYSTTRTQDIAPTIASILKIPYPNGTTGSPIEGVFLNVN